MDIQSIKKQLECPFCKVSSDKVHSVYQREIQDIPIHNRQTILLLKTRKMFCLNPECHQKTFSEPFEFVSSKSKKTKRLIDKIQMTTANLLKSHSCELCMRSCVLKISHTNHNQGHSDQHP